MGILGRNAFGIFFPSLSVPIVKILHVSNFRPAFLAQPRSDKHPPLLPWFHHHSNSTSGFLFFQPRSGPKKFERFVGKCLGRYKRTDRSVSSYPLHENLTRNAIQSLLNGSEWYATMFVKLFKTSQWQWKIKQE